jgi:hypothetical protein
MFDECWDKLSGKPAVNWLTLAGMTLDEWTKDSKPKKLQQWSIILL